MIRYLLASTVPGMKRPWSTDEEETALEEPLAAAESCEEPDPAAADESEEAADEPVPLEREPSDKEQAWPPEALYRSEALLIDDGELDDVYAMLEALGADPVRYQPDADEDFGDWENPPRAVVVSASAAPSRACRSAAM